MSQYFAELCSVDQNVIKGHSNFSLGKRFFQSLETMDTFNDNPLVAAKIKTKHFQNKILETDKNVNANYSINSKNL